MATFAGKTIDRQIILVVWVTVSGDQQGWTSPKAHNALLDTGAQGTMISKKVVNEIGLIPSGFFPIAGVTGSSITTEKYKVRIDIPILSEIRLPDGGVYTDSILRGKDIDVALFPDSFKPEAFDVLLGMDFLSAFHLTMVGDMFILSN